MLNYSAEIVSDISSYCDILYPNNNTSVLINAFEQLDDLTSQELSEKMFPTYNIINLAIAIENDCDIYTGWLFPSFGLTDSFTSSINNILFKQHAKCLPRILESNQVLGIYDQYTDGVFESYRESVINIDIEFSEKYNADCSVNNTLDFFPRIEDDKNVKQSISVREIENKLDTITLNELMSYNQFLKKRQHYTLIYKKLILNGIPIGWSVVRDEMLKIIPQGLERRDLIAIRFTQGILQAANKYQYTNNNN